MVRLDIDFELFMNAFERSSLTNYFIIDKYNNEIININEGIDSIENLDKYDSQSDSKRYLWMLKRTVEDDFNIIELFIYDLAESGE